MSPRRRSKASSKNQPKASSSVLKTAIDHIREFSSTMWEQSPSRAQLLKLFGILCAFAAAFVVIAQWRGQKIGPDLSPSYIAEDVPERIVIPGPIRKQRFELRVLLGFAHPPPENGIMHDPPQGFEPLPVYPIFDPPPPKTLQQFFEEKAKLLEGNKNAENSN